MATQAGPGPPMITIGASAGGIEPLMQIVGAFTTDLPAAVMVVVHGPSGSRSALPSVLSRAGRLPAEHPEDGDHIRPGRIYVGVPDRHLLVQDGVLRLSGGPQVNRTRPAIDPLFQSAAVSHGERVIGVVLSGALDDGTAGLAAIKSQGGITIVQDPDDAVFPSMPLSAIETVEPDHTLPADEIGALLVRLATSMPIPHRRRAPMPHHHAASGDESALGAYGATVPSVEEAEDPPGEISPFGCPDCGGTLWEIDRNGVLVFHCRVGHTYSPRHLLDAQADGVENGLWQAFRGLEEQASLARRLHQIALSEGHPTSARRFAEQEAQARRRAESIRRVLPVPAFREGTEDVDEGTEEAREA
jgi:two-component system, chemotaxis family, protein-glutamate methylesterase/glutaminase